MTADENKRLIQSAFDAWARGQGEGFWRLLSDDAQWTIAGTSLLAGTYTRSRFVEEALRPIGARLAQPITPTVQSIVADDDMVVVLWKGHATARDGQPYDNQYSWHLRFRDGAIVEATAFFDGATLDDLLARVPV
jgi:ketosteroid isomerase-like protein